VQFDGPVILERIAFCIALLAVTFGVRELLLQGLGWDDSLSTLVGLGAALATTGFARKKLGVRRYGGGSGRAEPTREVGRS
jgi:hypothetical protein